MKYSVNGFSNCKLIGEWISKLDDPLVYAEYENFKSINGDIIGKNSWRMKVIVCGSNESIMLLKYGHLIEQVL